ncbi:PH domain-containing protein [Dyadobacter sp. CY327]|uniref:PH domain-containing protein n=1 Tax=Dyadobacter sp. CY327 TaxID=2907301 RepID=UPI001F15D3A8|nr:PH domain-containing protein [Dyadobacter sp. CY327]MCE7069052.1 PH domain-containing protein [Dyadobacter sp. CY327]
MTNSEELNSFLTNYGFQPKETWDEIRELPSLIHTGEVYLAIIEGQLVKIHNRPRSGIGILVLTDRRTVFYRKSIMGTVTMEEIPLSKISSTSYRKGLVFSSICITASNNEAIIDYCQPALAKTFTDILQRKLNEPSLPQITTQTKEFGQLDEIEKLFSLKERGALTDEEFAHLKRKLLGI